MQEHFGFNDEEMKALTSNGVTIKHMFNFARDFDPCGKELPIGYLNLFFYVDKHGDIEKPPHFAHKKIARAIFEKLTIQQKIEISEYMEDCENGEF